MVKNWKKIKGGHTTIYENENSGGRIYIQPDSLTKAKKNMEEAWQVFREGGGFVGGGGDLKTGLKSKKKALKYARKWMRKHPLKGKKGGFVVNKEGPEPKL